MRDYQWQLELKYSPDQPRVPAGDPRGGQWIPRTGVVLDQNQLKNPQEQYTDEVREGAIKRVAARWKVNRSDMELVAREMGFQDADLKKRSDYELKRSLAYRWIRGWGGSSGGLVPDIAMATVADSLGLEYDPTEYQRRHLETAKKYPELGRVAGSFGLTMYAMTQEWLAGRGVRSVRLLRKGHLGERSLHTSWSLSWGGVRHDASSRPYQDEVIDAKYIFSLPPTGFGTLAESEVVVLPRG